MQQAKTRIANKIKKDEESKVINIDPKAKNE
jgi:hypothetical protein